MVSRFNHERSGAMRGKGERRGVSGWRALLDGFAGSGMTVSGFCEREGIAVSSFYRWQALLASAGGDEVPAPRTAVALKAAKIKPAFVEVGALQMDSPRLELHLDLGTGVHLHLVRG